MLRLIAVNRAFHFVVLTALGVLVLLFAADRATLRETFYKVVADLQGGVVASQSHASHGLLHEIDNAFTTSSSHLHLLGGGAARLRGGGGRRGRRSVVSASLGRVPDVPRDDLAAAAGDL